MKTIRVPPVLTPGHTTIAGGTIRVSRHVDPLTARQSRLQECIALLKQLDKVAPIKLLGIKLTLDYQVSQAKLGKKV